MKNTTIRGVTGLRGLAAWLVVLYHFREVFSQWQGTWWLLVVNYGYLAVDLFFILSGLVIYINYHADFERLDIRKALYFYGKRLSRIYPLHLVILLLYLLNPLAILLFSNAGDLSDRYSVSYYFLSLFLVQNWGFTQDLEWNIPAWSISTEWAAYLLFPVLVFGLKRFARWGTFSIFGLFVLLLLGLVALFSCFGAQSLGQNIAEIGVYRCILEFSLGLVLGHCFLQSRDQIQRISQLAFVLLIVWLAVSFVAAGPDARDYWVAPAAFALLIVVFLDDENAVARVFGARVPYYLGEISYSTYLVHYFVKDWVKFLSPELGIGQFFLYIVCVFLLSVVLYRQVETRCRVLLYQRLARSRTRSQPC
jgi:peptidoglycan/LPS O-acetylase OafA/YrhL